jgi:amino acid permease
MTLIRASVIAEQGTSQSLMSHCFGKAGEIVINCAFIFNSWGSMVSYCVIIGDVVPDVLKILMGEPQTKFMELFLSRRGQLVMISILVLLPISLNRSLAGLANFSIVALVGIVFTIGSLIAIGPSLSPEFAGSPGPLSVINPGGISRAIGVFSFAFVCHQNLLLNFHQMANVPNKLGKFESVARVAMILVSIAFLIPPLDCRNDLSNGSRMVLCPREIRIKHSKLVPTRQHSHHHLSPLFWNQHDVYLPTSAIRGQRHTTSLVLAWKTMV